MKNSRLIEFDFCRSICVLWIVAFWHLQYYLAPEFQLEGKIWEICRVLTNGVLATFTFLSGFFLKKYTFSNINDVIDFYKKRLIRFYPLYAISTVLMVILCGGGLNKLIASLLGYALFTNSSLQTLWYFNMLIIFYAITPLLPRFIQITRNKSVKIFLLQLMGVVIFLFLFYLFGDDRLWVYFPYYLLGLNCKYEYITRLSKNWIMGLVLLMIFVLFLFIEQTKGIEYMIILLFSFLIVSLSTKINIPTKFNGIIEFISLGSMCAYLFHRQFYALVLIVQKYITGFQTMNLFVATMAVVMLLCISYYIQLIYNKVINCLK